MGPLGFSRKHTSQSGHASTDIQALLLFNLKTTTAKVDIPTHNIRHPFLFGDWEYGDTVNSKSFILYPFIQIEKQTHRVWDEKLIQKTDILQLTQWSHQSSYTIDIKNDPVLSNKPVDIRALLKKYNMAIEEDESSLRDEVKKLAESKTKLIHSKKIRIPLVFKYLKRHENIDWDLLWLVNYKKDPSSESFDILKHLYRSERKENNVTRNIFPFISWDSRNSDTKFSLLWRIFQIHKANNKRGGYFFFIPFGEDWELQD